MMHYLYCTYPARANDFSQVNIHPVIAANQVPVVGLPIFEFHQLTNKQQLDNKNAIKYAINLPLGGSGRFSAKIKATEKNKR